jgi:hypothetical protein
MYSGACVFTDLATGYLHIELQISFTALSTLQATEHIEAMMKENGVIVHKCLTTIQPSQAQNIASSLSSKIRNSSKQQ